KPQPVLPVIIEIEPIGFGRVVPDRAQIVRKELQSHAQLVAERLGEVDAELGQLEAAPLRGREIVVAGAQNEALGNEPVNLQVSYFAGCFDFRGLGRLAPCNRPEKQQRPQERTTTRWHRQDPQIFPPKANGLPRAYAQHPKEARTPALRPSTPLGERPFTAP